MGAPGLRWGGDGALRRRLEPRAPRPAVPARPRSEPTAMADGLVLAPFWRRAAAWLVDFMLKLTLMYVVLAVVGGEAASEDPLLVSLPLFLATQLLWRGYELIFFTGGRTPGGFLFGLRIVCLEDGAPPGARRALLRTAGAFLSEQALFIGFAWALRSRLRQGWPDAMARTVVVDAPIASPPER